MSNDIKYSMSHCTSQNQNPNPKTQSARDFQSKHRTIGWNADHGRFPITRTSILYRTSVKSFFAAFVASVKVTEARNHENTINYDYDERLGGFCRELCERN